MKKVISLFLLSFVLLGVVQAQETKYISGGTARGMALGGSPNNAFMMDYSDIYTNPAWAIKYGDLVYSELGYSFAGYSASGQSAGFTYALSKGLAIGLSIGKQEGPIFAQNSYGSQFGVTNTTNSDNFLAPINDAIEPYDYSFASASMHPIQVYAALKLANLTLGFGIYRVSASGSDDYHISGDTINATAEASVVQTGFKAGALLDLDAMLLDVSALLRINSGSAEYDAPEPPAPALTNDESIKATGTEFGLNARLFMKLSNKFTLVPMARFYTLSLEPESKWAVGAGNKANSKPDKYGRTDFEVGIGTNIAFPDGRLFAGLSLESISLKHEVKSFVGGGTERPVATLMETTKYTTSVLSLPKVNLGAEFEIASWLTGRVGYFKAFACRTITTEDPAPAKKVESKETYEFQYMPSCSLAVADQLLSLGIGLHFGRLSIDGYLCEEWLADGPYVLSGSVNKMFAVVSMSYCFR